MTLLIGTCAQEVSEMGTSLGSKQLPPEIWYMIYKMRRENMRIRVEEFNKKIFVYEKRKYNKHWPHGCEICWMTIDHMHFTEDATKGWGMSNGINNSIVAYRKKINK